MKILRFVFAALASINALLAGVNLAFAYVQYVNGDVHSAVVSLLSAAFSTAVALLMLDQRKFCA